MKEANDQQPKKKSKLNVLLTIILVLAISMAITTFWFSKTYSFVPISGSSMENTFYNGDVVLCKKNSKVNRGDIVIIEGEGIKEAGNSKNPYLIIKRVVAIGGDTVKFKGGNLYLKKSGETEFTLQYETYTKDVDSTFYPDATDLTGVEESKEIFIPENQLFYLGDNRKVSHDSRSEDFSTCSVEQVIGVVTQKQVEKKERTKKVYNVIRGIFSVFNKGESN